MGKGLAEAADGGQTLGLGSSAEQSRPSTGGGRRGAEVCG